MPRLITVLLCLIAAASPVASQPPLDTSGLAGDADIAERAYRTLHPALYRYRSPQDFDAAFSAMRADFSKAQTRADVYVALARALAEIQCGHTYANFFNQPPPVREALFAGADKLPLTFGIIDGRMIIKQFVGEPPGSLDGAEITAIDGHDGAAILGAVMDLTKGDGARPSQRLYQLQVSGLGRFEAFDIYFPLLYPPKDRAYTVTVREADGGVRTVRLKTVTRSERLNRLKEHYGLEDQSVDASWAFDIRGEGVAYLKLGSFVTWRMDMDWRAFLEQAFARIEAENIRRLILDVRGNSGGDNDVLKLLLEKIAGMPLVFEPVRELMRYEKVPEDLRPYLKTWDPSFFDRTGKVEPVDNGYYTWIDAEKPAEGMPARDGAYDGKLYLLIDAGNSSATFTLSQILRNSDRATLIGQETGGNLRGISGGQILFLTLPHSGIEADIPLIGYFPLGPKPDAGIKPDIPVALTVADFRAGRDTVLEKALDLARRP